MFNLGKFLHDVIGNVEHTVGQGAANLANNVSHPQQFVNNLYHAIQPQHAQPSRGIPQQVDPRATSLPNVLGNILFHQVAQHQGFTPQFKQIIQNTHPQVLDGQDFSDFSGDPQADGSYNPATNRIAVQGSSVGPGINYELTHEGLHAAYSHDTPQQRANFIQLAQRNMSAADRSHISDALSGYGYNGDLSNLATAPGYAQNETHSYLPLGYYSNQRTQPIGQYYNQYFTNPNFGSK